jgi:acetoacetate decarboxylase
MNRDQTLGLSSMPAAAPGYPLPPFRFVDREYMTVIYENDPDAIRGTRPKPLAPYPPHRVFHEWIRMPVSSGFGDYTDSSVAIPCSFEGKRANFVAQMYLDDDPPIAAGCEIRGFPKKAA